MEKIADLYWFEENGVSTVEDGGHYQKYEIMQSTGLRDRNGTEIYEGDLLEEEKGYLFEVMWDAKYAKFRLQWKTKAHQYPEWNRGVKMQVVGNIHEHSALIAS